MSAVIIERELPTADDQDAIRRALTAFNDSRAGPSGHRWLALVIPSPASGETIGGLWGRSCYRWLFIEMLVVPEALRGQGVGTALMRRAEEIARSRGCLGIWLDTFSFQAGDFYRKLGFCEAGRIDDQPPGGHRAFLAKRL